MSDYHALLANEDASAREGYNFDPRVAYHTQSTVLQENMQTVEKRPGKELEDPQRYSGIPEGSHTDSNMLQATPKMITSKKYIIVDTSLRDWTRNPNPYSNVNFVFGNQGDTRKPIPIYSNNPTYPSFALPPVTSPGFTPIPGSSNTRGFSFIDQASGVQVDISAYNSSLPLGNFIGYDTPPSSFSSADYFGCTISPSNVQSIRLVRAILPQTPFFSYPTDPIFSQSASGAKTITSSTPYNTFGTYPYLLFYLNEYRGQYYAPTEAGLKAFAVLTQCNRMQINFSLTNGPQYFDYTPWNSEALEFQSPIASLKKLVISVADPQGNVFGTTQNDTLAVDKIGLATFLDSNGVLNESRATLICVTPAFQTYPQLQLRVGDRITFHTPTLKTMAASPAIAEAPSKKMFINNLLSNTFPVLEVATYSLDRTTNTYVVSTNISTGTDSRVDYFNVFFIPNFTTQQSNGTLIDNYPDAVDLPDYTILDIPGILGPGESLPFMNVTQQPVYTFELTVQSPDTSAIGGTVVN